MLVWAAGTDDAAIETPVANIARTTIPGPVGLPTFMRSSVDAPALASSAPCRIMRRDASGNVTEVTPQTVGSTAQQNSISVSVQVPGGASTAPIPLGAADGQIVVSSQNGADCVVTLEPQTR